MFFLFKRKFTTSTHPQRTTSFKFLSKQYFVDLQAVIDNDKSEKKTAALKTLVPEIRKQIHQVSERNAYKLLYPLAKAGAFE
jgi:hypothetical protein